MDVAPSIRLLAGLAEVMSLPARSWPADRTGIAPLSPRDLAAAYGGPMARIFNHALAQDLGLAALPFPDSVVVALKTDPALPAALRIAAAPFGELLPALRHLSAAIHARSVNSAVRKADRLAILDMLGEDAEMTAQRQADVFFPSLRTLAIDEPVQTPSAAGEAAMQDDETAWSRPAVAGDILSLPPALRRAFDVLCLYVASIHPTLADLMAARFGTAHRPAGEALTLSPVHAIEIRDLLERKVPAWSMPIA